MFLAPCAGFVGVALADLVGKPGTVYLAEAVLIADRRPDLAMETDVVCLGGGLDAGLRADVSVEGEDQNGPGYGKALIGTLTDEGDFLVGVGSTVQDRSSIWRR